MSAPALTYDPRLYWWPIALLLPLTLLLPVTWVGVSPVWAAVGPLVVYFLIVPALDHLFGQDHRNLTRATQGIEAHRGFYRALMYASVPLYMVGMAAVLWVIRYGGLPLWLLPLLIFGAGIMLGSVILVGHELGHSVGSKADKWLGMLALAAVGYGHFTIEHNRGHHLTVATPEDPASAPKGMSLYRFAQLELWGVWIGALRHQRAALNRKGHGWWSLHNTLMASWTMTLIWFAALTIWLGPLIIPALIALCFFAWFALTMANYIEHYGLRRKKLGNGKYEPCQPHHSWNSSFAFTNLLSFHLQRHSDHHVNASKPYQSLEHMDQAPQLPSGYPGCFAIALFPPLWFAVMNPKLPSLEG